MVTIQFVFPIERKIFPTKEKTLFTLHRFAFYSRVRNIKRATASSFDLRVNFLSSIRMKPKNEDFQDTMGERRIQHVGISFVYPGAYRWQINVGVRQPYVKYVDSIYQFLVPLPTWFLIRTRCIEFQHPRR